MFFINPMWDNESQRIGKMKCTHLGYKLHGISDGLGFLGLFCFIGIIIFLVISGVMGGFRLAYLWLFLVPFCLDVLATLLHAHSWHMAEKNGFEYDYENREASWIEDGKRIVYKWERDRE